MNTIFTAIFSPYEPLRDTTIVTPGWEYICFTDQPFKSKIWKIKRVESPENPRLEARKYKALFFDYVYGDKVIWIDGSFCVNCDLNQFWERYYLLPFSAPKHHKRDCVYELADTILAGKRGGHEGIEFQIESYRNIIPMHSGLITSGILLRQDTNECIALCKDWLKETEKWSQRDQISFARVSLQNYLNDPERPYKDIIHTFDYPYPKRTEFIYHPHSKRIVNNTLYF